jgi:hypothetical protein
MLLSQCGAGTYVVRGATASRGDGDDLRTALRRQLDDITLHLRGHAGGTRETDPGTLGW